MTSTIAPVETASAVETAPSNASSGVTVPQRADLSRKLPYQPTHQVELLNLQAETEALLQQIRLAQKRRELCDAASASALFEHLSDDASAYDDAARPLATA